MNCKIFNKIIIFILFLFFENFYCSTLNFHSPQAAIVLENSRTYFATPSMSTITGWYQQNIIKEGGYQNIRTFGNTLTYSCAPEQQVNNYLYNTQVQRNLDLSLDGKIIYLNEDLFTTNSMTFLITSSGIIDGLGKSLILGKYSQILLDCNVCVTFKNIIFKNDLNTLDTPPIALTNYYSQITFDNTTFNLNDDFAFNNGQFFIKNDVNFTGSFSFNYNAIKPSYILPNSSLNFGPNSFFSFYPSTTYNDLIVMHDKSSKIKLNNSTLLITNTGLKLKNGSLYLDNKTTLSTYGENLITGFGTALVSRDVGPNYVVSWHPNGRYLACGISSSTTELLLFYFNGSSLALITELDFGGSNSKIYGADWSPNGKYLAIGGYNPLTTHNEFEVYYFNGTSLELISSENYGTQVSTVAWNPDGKHIAIGGMTPIFGHDEIEIYSFDGSSLELIDTKNYGDDAQSVSWSPDGKYLAVCGDNPSGDDILIYYFNGSSLSLIEGISYTDNAYSVNWSRDGKYLAVGGYTSTYQNQIKVYYFDGTATTLITSASYGVDTSVKSVKWSPNGKYLLIGAAGPATVQAMRIYSFTGQSLDLIDSVEYATYGNSVAWSNDGKKFAIAGRFPDPGYNSLEIRSFNYTPDISPQAFSNSLIFGDSSLGSEQDLNTYINSDARVYLDGKLYIDNSTSAQNNLNFANRGSNINFDKPLSKIKVTNNSGINGWSEQSITLSDGNNNNWISDNTIYGFDLGETEPSTYLVYSNSNAIVTHDKEITWNSNAILNMHDPSLQDRIKNNSNAIISLAPKIHNNSQAIINDYEITDNLQTQITTNSNFIINQNNKIKYNSNAIIQNSKNIIYNSNALIKNTKDIHYNSQSIIRDSEITADIQYKIKNNSNAILTQNKNIYFNSNAIINHPAIELKEQIKHNSDAIVSLDTSILAIAVKNNSNAILYLDTKIHYNSQAILHDYEINADLEDQIRYNSNAIINSDPSSLEPSIKNNSDAIVSLDWTAIAPNINNNSNAILNLNTKIYYNSNAIINDYEIKEDLQDQTRYNSNAIINSDPVILSQEIKHNSDAIIEHDKKINNNSNAIIRLSNDPTYPLLQAQLDTITTQVNSLTERTTDVQTDLTATNTTIDSANSILDANDTDISDLEGQVEQLEIDIKNNSNAIVTQDPKIVWNSNAIVKNSQEIDQNTLNNGYNTSAINKNTNDINYITQIINGNSNTILTHDDLIRWNSSAILNIDTEELAIYNSNAIIKIDNDIRHISSTTETNNNLIKYNSNAILHNSPEYLSDQIKHNSDAIINLEVTGLQQEIINNSNAIIYLEPKIHYNSQAIIHDYEITDDIQNQINYNSNTIINSDAIIASQNIKHNSDAIVTLQRQSQNSILTNGPIASDISLDSSVFIHPNQRIYINGNVTINGNGAVIIFANPNHSQFIIEKNKTVTLKNIQLLRINQKTFDFRYNSYFDISKPTHYALDDSKIIIGQNVLFGLSENITMSQGFIEITNNDNNQAQNFYIKGIEGQKRFELSPSDNYSDALSKADNGLTWLQRKDGQTSLVPSQLPDRFTQNATIPVLIKCNDNTLSMQSIILSGFEHITKTDSLNYLGSIGLLGETDINIGDKTFTEFEINQDEQETYNMNFVVQDINNNLNLIKDDVKFTGKLRFADLGDNELFISTELTEPITPKAGSLDPNRTVPQIKFGTNFMLLNSNFGSAKLIFKDNVLRINNSIDGFVAYENSNIAGNTLEITGDPIHNMYNTNINEKNFTLNIDKLIGLNDINNKPIVTENYLYFYNKNLEQKNAIDLIYNKEINNILNS
ncbi:hypothetical protein L6269_01255 [Candidatus Dependentiae bacterium]|nr:hypothetical protein [Candidatus Dependentiae bacterium]